MNGTYNTNSQTRFKTSMLKKSLCDHSDTYILGKGTTTVLKTRGNNTNNTDKK